MREIRKKLEENTIIDGILCFVIVFAMMLVLYRLKGFAPFWKYSLANIDADIQYLDFYCFLKDVLSGKNNFSYSFSKELGGNCIGLFSYYLASPVNILVVLFDKSDMVAFYDICVAVKMGLAGLFCNIFLCRRFLNIENKDRQYINRVIIMLLSAAYAMGQYTLYQSQNAIWLDGVYMLPLMLLGVYRVVKDGDYVPLAVFSGLAVLFNWYTAGINYLFTFIWLAFEIALYYAENREVRIKAGDIRGKAVKYCIAMLLGLGIAAALFLPTVYVLRNSAKGGFGFRSFILNFVEEFKLIGKPAAMIEMYSIGAISNDTDKDVSLYCGALALTGVIAVFLSRRISGRIKAVIGSMLFVLCMVFYFYPFFMIFSLGSYTGSYFCRYSYIGIMTLVFISAFYFINYSAKNEMITVFKAGISFACVQQIMNYVSAQRTDGMIDLTGLFFILITISAGLMLRAGSKKVKLALLAVLCVFSAVELYCSANATMDIMKTDNAWAYRDYSIEEQELIDSIESYDNNMYRITQTVPRFGLSNGITAYYDESFAYGYCPNVAYTSTPDDNQLNFLDRLGYINCANTMNIVNTSIISADSLLGVKYMMSPYQINGYVSATDITPRNGKNVYENPFTLPMAFTFADDGTEVRYEGDPFEYQNGLYSRLLGRETAPCVHLDYVPDETGETSVIIKQPEGEYALYGNLPWTEWTYMSVRSDSGLYTAYACWLSPSVFYIPENAGSDTCRVTVRDKGGNVIPADRLEGLQLYAVDLEALGEISAELKAKQAAGIDIQNGKASFTAISDGNETLYVSIPYDKGWKIKVNGKDAQPGQFGGCMLCVPLEAGENRVEMVYHVPLLTAGLIISLISVIALAALVYIKKTGKQEAA